MSNQEKTITIATGILKNQGKILLLKRSDKVETRNGMWQFPEGKLEAGENIEEALKREILEETELKVKSYKYLNTQKGTIKAGKDNYYVTRIIFEVKWEGKITLSEEHTEYKWVDKNHLECLRTVAGVKEIIFSL